MTSRVAVIGSGSAGTRHADLAIRHLPHAEVVQVKDLDQVRDMAPDIGVVAAASTAHVSAIALLRTLGAHVLVEKPLAATADDARSIVEAPRTDGGIELVGYNLRFTKSLAALRGELLNGSIGTALSANACAGQWLPDWRPGRDYRTTVSAQRSLGGGALLELSHEFDYLAWLLGPPRWVMADISRRSDLQIDVDDCVDALVAHGDPDATGTQLVSSVKLDMFRRDPTRWCEIVGTEGTLRWDGIRGRVDVFHDEWRSVAEHAHDIQDSYDVQWQHFLACIRGEETPLITIPDAYSTLLLLEACRTSSAEGRRTQVEQS